MTVIHSSLTHVQDFSYRWQRLNVLYFPNSETTPIWLFRVLISIKSRGKFPLNV